MAPFQPQEAGTSSALHGVLQGDGSLKTYALAVLLAVFLYYRTAWLAARGSSLGAVLSGAAKMRTNSGRTVARPESNAKATNALRGALVLRKPLRDGDRSSAASPSWCPAPHDVAPRARALEAWSLGARAALDLSRKRKAPHGDTFDAPVGRPTQGGSAPRHAKANERKAF